MKRYRWEIILATSLIAASAILYLIHYAIFRDMHHIFIYLLGDVAFVPINVLLVTLIIHELLNEREKRSRMEKMNMVIGAFFSEVGTMLLTYMSDFDPKLDEIKKNLIVRNDWSDSEFSEISRRLRQYEYSVDMTKVDLAALRDFLVGKRDFLLRLLENPNLLEHESFTELLRSVFHLTEELAGRTDIAGLPESDYKHLAGDIKRVYTQLVIAWLDYMKHLKGSYPYLFSLAMRTNPFDQTASPIVR
jgi:hypothetical protein